MGTFVGHVLPGVAFVMIGIWHLFNTIRNYVEAPWNFQSRAWFPARFSRKYLRYLELELEMLGACLSIAAELFICPKKHQPFADDWSIPYFHLNNFEHSTISLFFFVFASTCLVTDLFKIHMPRGLLNVMGAFAFSQELMLFHFHSADHMGLEGHFHWLLQLPIFVGLAAALLEIVAPKAVIISFVRAISIVFQGTWFIQMGLDLYVSSMVPTGCVMVYREGHWEVTCATKKALMRAKALANLFFSWHLVVILVFALLLYVGMMYHHSAAQMQYEPLMTSLKANVHDEVRQVLKDVEAATSPRSASSQGGSHNGESDIEMSAISLER